MIEWKELEEYNPDSDNLFEYIAKSQHYGSKTRFLDFSTDINVALFFACNEFEEKDASLYICPSGRRIINCCDTIIISELALLKNEIAVAEFANKLFSGYSKIRIEYDNLEELSRHVVSWLDHGFIVLPDINEYEEMKESNKRLYNQKGAFFVCGNETKKPLDLRSRTSSHAGYNIILPRICDVPETMQASNRSVTKLRIPSSLKRDFLEYLNGKGINADYLLVK